MLGLVIISALSDHRPAYLCKKRPSPKVRLAEMLCETRSRRYNLGDIISASYEVSAQTKAAAPPAAVMVTSKAISPGRPPRAGAGPTLVIFATTSCGRAMVVTS